MRELEDRKWFPEFLRRHQMEYLSFISNTFNIYQPVRKMFAEAIERSRHTSWTDACSGMGGPIAAFDLPNQVLLTDLFPPKEKLNLKSNMAYYPEPVNLETELPPGNGLISLFNGFHHFNHHAKKEIINRAKKANRPFFFVEILQPSVRYFFSVLFTTTVGHWLAVPFMKPFSWTRILFTYLLPLHTITICIDGIISVFKSKSSGFYRHFCQQLSTNNYQIKLIEIKGISGNIIILQGGLDY